MSLMKGHRGPLALSRPSLTHRVGTCAGARSAVTLVEVVFSIAVILIGLVGLVSVMPLAGYRAQEAVTMSIGASFGDAVLKEIQMRRWIRNLALIDYSTLEAVKYEPGLTTGPSLTLTDANADPNLHPKISAVCIDPLYIADRVDQNEPFLSVIGYNDAVFPYYASTPLNAATHDPLLNPSEPNPVASPGTNTWPTAQPRMRRVGFGSLSGFTRPFTFPDTLIVGLEQARTIVESQNDVVFTRPKDRSENARVNGLQAGGLEYGRRAPSGEYSWIATISPLPGNRFASVSVVVTRNRDRARDYPSTPETDPRDNGVNERIAYVTFASGFSGGAGGTVHLTSSANTATSLVAGDWVMLSRRIPTVPTPPPPQLPYVDFHRWYRVVAVDGEPEEFTPLSSTLLETGGAPLPDPGFARTPVWRHKVLLDGPDWSFGFPVPGSADGTFVDNTFATIMTDVVSVTERVIPLTDL